MAKFIKIKDDEMINVDHIALMVEKKTYDTDEPYTRICLTHPPFTVTTDLTLDELYNLIEDCSKN